MDKKMLIREFMKNKSARKDIHLSVDIEQINDGLEVIQVLSPVKVDGTIYMTEDILNFEAKIEASLRLTCSRCLQPFEMLFEDTVDERFTLDNDNKDDDVIFIDSDSLNITEIIMNNIILSLPIKRLCKDDCKGLCQVCGTNLNFNSCDCTNDNIDPRLAKLKDLF